MPPVPKAETEIAMPMSIATNAMITYMIIVICSFIK